MNKYTLPSWVFKRDGRLVPFESDKISQALFAATEARGRPNAFLARELTDGVLHFLGAETNGDNPTTEEIAEIVAKVTRELGHPELARTYLAARSEAAASQGATTPTQMLSLPAAESPPTARRDAAASIAYRKIFTRDLASAQEEGLVQLSGLEHPEAVDRMVVEPRGMRHSWGESLLDEMVRLRSEVARHFVLDSPDHLLPVAEACAWARQLCRLLDAMDRRAIVNLNIRAAPSWACDNGVGPLFAAGTASPERHSIVEGASTGETAAALLESLNSAIGKERVTVDWHIDEKNLTAQELNAPCRFSQGIDWRWTLDRPGRPISLGEGLDREHGCVLLEIGLNLARFFNLEGVDGQLERFLEKLPSLANMAISAAVQKRMFLSRTHGSTPYRLTRLAQGFLLYRARAAIVLLGLDEVVWQALGRSTRDSKAAQELEQKIIRSIQASAAEHGRTRNIEIVLERNWQPNQQNEPTGSLIDPSWLTILRQAWKRPEVGRVEKRAPLESRQPAGKEIEKP